MAFPQVFTFADVLDTLDYFSRSMGVGADLTLRRQVVRAAYREVAGARDWTFLRSNARITLRGAQTEGTISYSQANRQVTLTGATWPSWAEDASLRFGDPDLVCDIEEVLSSTVATLDAVMAPVDDIASSTYTLYPRWYRLPRDFAGMAEPMNEESWVLGRQVSKTAIEQLNRYEARTGSTIEYYAFGAPLDLYGERAIYVHPPSDTTKTLDIPYLRRPRDLVISGYDSARDTAGTISVAAGSDAVTGTDTAFDSGMVNSILRIGQSSTYPPGGLESSYPYAEQRVIKSVTDATNLVLDAGVSATHTGVKYRISDPVDLDVILWDTLLRAAEMHLARVLRAKAYSATAAEYQRALHKAREADCRGIQPEIAGPGRAYTGRLTDSPHRPLTGFA